MNSIFGKRSPRKIRRSLIVSRFYLVSKIFVNKGNSDGRRVPFRYRGRQSGEARHTWRICVFGIFVVPPGWIHPWPSVSSLYSTRIRGTLHDCSHVIAHNTLSVSVVKIFCFILCHFLCYCIAYLRIECISGCYIYHAP